MDPISLAAGALGASVLALVFSIMMVKRIKDAAEAETESRTALLASQLDQTESTRRDLASELAITREKLAESSEKRAIAETTAHRVPVLEAEMRDLRLTLDQWREKGAELETALEKEREAAAEKLAMLEDAKTKLLDSFKALSSDALKVNNDEFMKLARRSEEHTSELQSHHDLVCRLLLEKKNKKTPTQTKAAPILITRSDNTLENHDRITYSNIIHCH